MVQLDQTAGRPAQRPEGDGGSAASAFRQEVFLRADVSPQVAVAWESHAPDLTDKCSHATKAWLRACIDAVSYPK
jgi:hypothetical protein